MQLLRRLCLKGVEPIHVQFGPVTRNPFEQLHLQGIPVSAFEDLKTIVGMTDDQCNRFAEVELFFLIQVTSCSAMIRLMVERASPVCSLMER